MKKYAKENYLNNIDNSISNHDTESLSKTFKQTMRKFIGGGVAGGYICKIPSLHTADYTFAFPNQEKTHVLYNFCISVSDIEDANIALPDCNNRTVLSQIKVSKPEEVNIISILKVNKATGLDGRSNKILKYTSK